MQPYEGEIWNEHQWEQHLTEMEYKSEKLRVYIETNLGESSPRWSRFLNGFPSKLDAIDAYIEDELMFEDAYFPDDEDDWDDEDEDMDDFFLSADDDAEDEDLEDGEEWKKALGSEYKEDPFSGGELSDTSDSDADIATWIANEILDNPEDYADMHIYDEARELAADMLRLAEIVPMDEQDEKFIQLITGTVNVGSRIAGAFAFGFDLDVLGGNISYCKRALRHANEVLELLQELKPRAFMRYLDYETLHERMFDLRNDLGVHIQELRTELVEGLENGGEL